MIILCLFSFFFWGAMALKLIVRLDLVGIDVLKDLVTQPFCIFFGRNLLDLVIQP